MPTDLLTDVRTLIEQARDATARAINWALVLFYWQVGTRIRKDILKEQRAEYGEQIVPTLSAQLAPEYGDGFSKRNLFRMIQLAERFPDGQIVATLSKQLGWSHFVEIIPLKDELKRDFYAEMCRIERWSVRTLREQDRRHVVRADRPVEEAGRAGEAGTRGSCAPPTSYPRTSCSATRTSSTSWASRTPTRKPTWKRPFSARWSRS